MSQSNTLRVQPLETVTWRALCSRQDLVSHSGVVVWHDGAQVALIYLPDAAQQTLYAIDNHVERLADDHANARLLAEAVSATPGLTLDPPRVQTNVVWFRVDARLGTPKALAAVLKDRGILVAALGHDMVRLVTHLDVSRADCETAARAIRAIAPAG